MSRFRDWWPLVAVPALLIGLALGALWLTTYDYTARVTKAVLANRNGDLSAAALTAALRAQFPDGSSVESVKEFSVKLGGQCFVGAADFATYCGTDSRSAAAKCTTTLYCNIPLAGIICMGTWMALKAHLQSGSTVSELSARTYTQGC